MCINFLTVYHNRYNRYEDPEYGVFWSESGWESSDWTKVHLRGTYTDICKHVEEHLPFRLPTKERLKQLEYGGGDFVTYSPGSGVVYINIIKDGQFINFKQEGC